MNIIFTLCSTEHAYILKRSNIRLWIEILTRIWVSKGVLNVKKSYASIYTVLYSGSLDYLRWKSETFIYFGQQENSVVSFYMLYKIFGIKCAIWCSYGTISESLLPRMTELFVIKNGNLHFSKFGKSMQDQLSHSMLK